MKDLLLIALGLGAGFLVFRKLSQSTAAGPTYRPGCPPGYQYLPSSWVNNVPSNYICYPPMQAL